MKLVVKAYEKSLLPDVKWWRSLEGFPNKGRQTGRSGTGKEL